MDDVKSGWHETQKISADLVKTMPPSSDPLPSGVNIGGSLTSPDENPSTSNSLSSQLLTKTVLNRENRVILANTAVELFRSLHNNSTLSCLIDDHSLNKVIVQNPWEVNIKKSLTDLQSRLYDNPQIKFRIGGRAIYSASQIVRVKSVLTVEESQKTQENLRITEIDADDLGTEDNFAEGMDSSENQDLLNEFRLPSGTTNDSSLGKLVDAISFLTNPADMRSVPGFENVVGNAESCAQLVSMLKSREYHLYEQDRTGKRFLKSPLRQINRHLQFEDLTEALLNTLNYQIRHPPKMRSGSGSPHPSIKDILPENIIKKAEDERALIEDQINYMFEKVKHLYSPEHPVSFFQLIVSPDIDGIVRTLLYLLHLTNRKKIELWQIFTDDPGEPVESKRNRRKAQPIPDEPVPIPKNHENAVDPSGINVFIIPLK